MSAIKKIAGLVVGAATVGGIGFAVAQGVPPNPMITNPALGAGEQTVHLTPIGETGVLAWADTVQVQQTAVLTREADRAAVASQPAPEPAPVAAASTTTTESTQVAQAPVANDNANSTRAMGAGPAPAEEQHAAPMRKARHDRG